MTKQVDAELLRSIGPSYLIGEVYLGTALDQTGVLHFFNSSSALDTTFKAGNTTAAINYVLPTAGPSGNDYTLVSTTTGVLSWFNSPGTYAPIGAAFVTIGNTSGLTAERSLTGTSNQITVTDNGANSTVVLSTPQNIHSGASPTFTGLTLSGLTASRLMSTNGSSALSSVSALTSWIAGTANQITVTDDGDGTVTLSTPQNIHTAASPTFAGLTLSGLTATRLVATGGGSALASVASLSSWIAGTANQITVTDDGDGTITLSTPQNLHTAATPTFGSITITNTVTCGDIDTGNGAVELAAGTYTPTLTNVANLSASTAYQCQYLRVGNTVTVSGKVDADQIATATSTSLGISLPIASNFGATEDCGGTGAVPDVASLCTAILADSANDRADMTWVSIGTANVSIYFTFTYQVI